MSDSETLLLWLSIISVLACIGSLTLLPWLVARIPPDYFSHERRIPSPWKDSHPALRLGLILLKNLLGYVLLAGGLVMVFIPGQGLLTMAMGLVLMDYPGKYQLERRLVSRPAVLRGLNWLRHKRRVPPLQLD